jgi:glycosyltransferase involved in cell wall biosynthesis
MNNATMRMTMEKDLPLVSIVTPAYNRASYLDGVIKSILEQDYPNIEYIVLDDGSKDNTREVLEKYTGKITWESHANMGETRTNNKGWKMAHGDIIATVNSDDPLLPGAIRTAVEFMQSHPDILVAYPDWNMIGPQGELIRHMRAPDYDYCYMLRKHHCSVGPAAFIRRKSFELTEMRDPAFRYVADFEYWLRLGVFGPFARIPKTLATFRFHPDSASVSQTGDLMASEHIKLIDKIYSLSNLPYDAIKIKPEAYSSANYIAGVVCGKRGNPAKRAYFKNALSLSPWSYIARYPGRLLVMMPAFIGFLYYPLKAIELLVRKPRLLFQIIRRKQSL